jgi:hypothetical protein
MPGLADPCRDKLLQLVRLALRLNRVALLPDPVCSATWVSSERRSCWSHWHFLLVYTMPCSKTLVRPLCNI